MEFFKSKYFFDRQQTVTPSTARFINLNHTIVTNDGLENPLQILDTYLLMLPMVTNHSLCLEYVKQNCELVTDLVRYQSTGKSIKHPEYNLVHVYYHPELELFIHVTRPDDKKFLATYRFFIPVSKDSVTTMKEIMSRGFVTEDEANTQSRVSILVAGNQSFHLQRMNISSVNIDFNTMYSKDFKTVKENMVRLVQPDGPSGIIVLHGAPGTGKSSFLKWLTAQTDRKFVFMPTHLVPQLSDPKFIRFLIDNPDLTFIIEDAEAVLESRGNTRSAAMSALLNMADGFLSEVVNAQFICTFNADISKVDDALLREGRLLLRHELSLLGPEQVNAFLDKNEIRNSKYRDQSVSLAALMNESRSTHNRVIEKEKSFGFIR